MNPAAKLLAVFLFPAALAACGAGDRDTDAARYATGESALCLNKCGGGQSCCTGSAYSNIPADHRYYLTTFGGGSDTGTMSCGGTADGTWWYAADRQRFGCHSIIKITNPANGKCGYARTDDYGPGTCVEDAACMPIIDASPVVAQHLFGASSSGWSSKNLVIAELAPAGTPIGPCPTGPDYAADWSAQSAPAEMTSGDSIAVWVEYKNTGNKAWDASGTRLGTTEPRDRQSPFFVSGNWIGPNRPTAADHATAPGAVGRFTFMFQAPEVAADTTFTEHWGLLQESLTWFGPPDAHVYFQVLVHPRPAAPDAGVPPFPDAGTGGHDAGSPPHDAGLSPGADAGAPSGASDAGERRTGDARGFGCGNGAGLAALAGVAGALRRRARSR
jgi:hypothetical protein